MRLSWVPPLSHGNYNQQKRGFLRYALKEGVVLCEGTEKGASHEGLSDLHE